MVIVHIFHFSLHYHCRFLFVCLFIFFSLFVFDSSFIKRQSWKKDAQKWGTLKFSKPAALLIDSISFGGDVFVDYITHSSIYSPFGLHFSIAAFNVLLSTLRYVSRFSYMYSFIYFPFRILVIES